MVKNLKDAKRYVDRIKKCLIKNVFTNRDTTDSLKIFAGAKEGERFNIVVELMCSEISTQKPLKLYSKEPLALVESFCMVLDHPIKENFNMFQCYRGLKIKRLPIGKTQKFFQKIYGSHFFKK